MPNRLLDRSDPRNLALRAMGIMCVFGVLAALAYVARAQEWARGRLSLVDEAGMLWFCGILGALFLGCMAWAQRRESFRIGGAEVDLRAGMAIVLSILLPMFHNYGYVFVGSREWDQFILYFAVTLAVIVCVWGDSPQKYGLCLGRWKEGLAWTAVGAAGMAIILYYLAHQDASMQGYYRGNDPRPVAKVVWTWGVEMWAWEFIWRGFYLFALIRVMGPGPAILLQAVPFAYLHMGKPALEAFSTPFGGAAFGFVAWRSRSFVYAFLIHWFMITFLELASSGRL